MSDLSLLSGVSEESGAFLTDIVQQFATSLKTLQAGLGAPQSVHWDPQGVKFNYRTQRQSPGSIFSP